MAYTYINREIYPNMLVLDEPLDDNYAKGNSYDDYINGNPAPWIELGEEQLAFKEANPKATVKEIIEARLDESRVLNEEKSAKYEELRSYETENLHEFFLDDQNIYIPEYGRRNALADGAIVGKITIMGLEFDITEGKILIGMMDKYDNDLTTALGDKQKQISIATTVEQVKAVDVQIPDGRQIRCISYNKVTYFDLDDICKLCFGSYDLHDVADTKVMSEFLHREGGRYWVTVDGVRQLYRRIECKMCFEVIEKLRGL